MTGTESDRYLLDTSSVLALVEDEPGADRVEELLRTATVLLPFVAGLEAYYITLRERGVDEAERRPPGAPPVQRPVAHVRQEPRPTPAGAPPAR